MTLKSSIRTPHIAPGPEGRKASLNYAAGILKLNGKVFDATVFANALNGANVAINAMLSNKVERSVPVVLPQSGMEAEEASPEEAGPAKNSDEGA